MFIDTFLFNGDWITKLRLEYLYDFVDFFYIVENKNPSVSKTRYLP